MIKLDFFITCDFDMMSVTTCTALLPLCSSQVSNASSAQLSVSVGVHVF